MYTLKQCHSLLGIILYFFKVFKAYHPAQILCNAEINKHIKTQSDICEYCKDFGFKYF